MANVTMTLSGQKTLTSLAQLPAAATAYIEIAAENGLAPRAFAINREIDDGAGGRFPTSIIFQYQKLSFPEGQVEAVLSIWKALGVTKGFDVLDFIVKYV